MTLIKYVVYIIIDVNVGYAVFFVGRAIVRRLRNA